MHEKGPRGLRPVIPLATWTTTLNPTTEYLVDMGSDLAWIKLGHDETREEDTGDGDVHVMDSHVLLYNLVVGLFLTLGHRSPPLPRRTCPAIDC
jgi:hypothetical protein